jgi:hypothetical protein
MFTYVGAHRQTQRAVSPHQSRKHPLACTESHPHSHPEAMKPNNDQQSDAERGVTLHIMETLIKVINK